MAKNPDYISFELSVSPYEYEGNKYDGLHILVGHSKGMGFSVSYQAVKITDMGYMTGPMPSSDKMVKCNAIVVREAARNNYATLQQMAGAIKAGAECVAAAFDARRFALLNNLLKVLCNKGYTDDLPDKVAKAVNTPDYSDNQSTSSQTQNNSQTMATKNINNKTVNMNRVENLNDAMEQYRAEKKQHPDAMLLFRFGESYVLLDKDAEQANEVLGLGLDDVGTLYFQAAQLGEYMPKLHAAGHRIAMSELKQGVVAPATAYTVKDAEGKDVTFAPTVPKGKKNPEPLTVNPEPAKQEVSTTALPTLTLTMVPTSRDPGKLYACITGFADENDPRYSRNVVKREKTDRKKTGKKADKKAKAEEPVLISATWRSTMDGKRVLMLTFRPNYTEQAKALLAAYNGTDRTAWERAEAAFREHYDAIVASSVAEREAKRNERKANAATTVETKPAQGTMTNAQVLDLIQRLSQQDPEAMKIFSEMQKAA